MAWKWNWFLEEEKLSWSRSYPLVSYDKVTYINVLGIQIEQSM